MPSSYVHILPFPFQFLYSFLIKQHFIMSDTPTSTRNENKIVSPAKEINQITMNCVICHCTKKQKNDKPTCSL
jgi:hypothetical protein